MIIKILFAKCQNFFHFVNFILKMQHFFTFWSKMSHFYNFISKIHWNKFDFQNDIKENKIFHNFLFERQIFQIFIVIILHFKNLIFKCVVFFPSVLVDCFVIYQELILMNLEEEPKNFFSPPLWRQRQVFVSKFIEENEIKSVADIGCGE